VIVSGIFGLDEEEEEESEVGLSLLLSLSLGETTRFQSPPSVGTVRRGVDGWSRRGGE
jgi:hypothetical protein